MILKTLIIITSLRSRRFRSSYECLNLVKSIPKRSSDIRDTLFDPNSITPGTEFMYKLNVSLREFVVERMKVNRLWQRLKIYFSGSDVPGEGEHKIVSFIRERCLSSETFRPNERHCINGQDADMIMLSLTTHLKYFYILREVLKPPINTRKFKKKPTKKTKSVISFQFIRVNILRECLVNELTEELVNEAFEMERIIDDFVFLTFFVGNDFLPNIPTLSINESAFDIIFQAYKDILSNSIGYIVKDGKIDDFGRFYALLRIMGTSESTVLTDNIIAQSSNSSCNMNEHQSLSKNYIHDIEKYDDDSDDCNCLDDDGEISINDIVDLIDDQYIAEPHPFNEKLEAGSSSVSCFNHRSYYYSHKFGINIDDYDGKICLERIVHSYLDGLAWCLSYYSQGCHSWSWYYAYHYAPLLFDLVESANCKLSARSVNFDLNEPYTPFQQLLGCLPPFSACLLPASYHCIMLNESSPMFKYYPKELKFDYNGKKNSWEAIVLLDFIDENMLKETERNYNCVFNCDPTEICRNSFGSVSEYLFDSSSETLIECKVDYSILPSKHAFRSELMSGTPMKLCGFPDLHDIIAVRSMRPTGFPSNCTIRLRLNESLDAVMMALALNIQTQFPAFIPHFALSTCVQVNKPYSVILCSGLNNAIKSVDEVMSQLLPNAAKLFKQTTLRMDGRLVQTNNSQIVLGLIDVSNGIELGKYVCSALNGCNSWYVDEPDRLSIVIGTLRQIVPKSKNANKRSSRKNRVQNDKSSANCQSILNDSVDSIEERLDSLQKVIFNEVSKISSCSYFDLLFDCIEISEELTSHSRTPFRLQC